MFDVHAHPSVPELRTRVPGVLTRVPGGRTRPGWSVADDPVAVLLGGVLGHVRRGRHAHVLHLRSGVSVTAGMVPCDLTLSRLSVAADRALLASWLAATAASRLRARRGATGAAEGGRAAEARLRHAWVRCRCRGRYIHLKVRLVAERWVVLVLIDTLNSRVDDGDIENA